MSAAAPTAGTTPAKKHRFWVWAIIVIAAIVTLVSSLTIFVKREALNSQSFSETSVKMLQDQQVRDALAVYLTDQLFANVDVKAQLENILPNQTKGLAGPASGLLREFAPRAASDILAQPAVQNQFQTLTYNAHKRFLTIIDGKNQGPVQTQNGEVVLDLHPIVEQLADRLGLGAQIKPDAGRLVVFSSSQLKLVQDSVKAIKVLNVFLIVVVLLLYALAIWLAAGWRRQALRASGWSLLIVGVLLLLVRRVVGNQIVGSLVNAQSDKTAARHAWLIGSSLLAAVAWAIVFYGIVILISAWIAGRTRPAVAVRRWLAPALAGHLGVVVTCAIFLYLMLILWGPTAALQQWWGILLAAAFFSLGFWALRRETLREFPNAGVTTEWPNFRASWNKMRGGGSQGGGPEPPPA